MALKISKLTNILKRRTARNHKRQRRDLLRPTFEKLESRRVLAGYFDEIADDISGPNGAMSTITSGLRAVSSLAKLPLINKPLGQISQLTDSLAEFQTDLDSTLRSLGPASSDDVIRNEIFSALGPSGANVLASKSGASDPVASDVVVTTNLNAVDISIDLGYTSDQFATAIGLGVDSVPMKPANNTTGKFSVGLNYRDFHFGYNTVEGVYFRTNTSSNELQLKLNGFLPNSFTAGLGFLNVSVTDMPRTPGRTPQDADLELTVSADVTGGFGSNDPPLAISSPRLSGGLDLQADAVVQVGGDGMPKLSTELVFQWELPDVSASTPFGGSWGAPLLAFNNVKIDLSSLLGSIAEPIADDVRAILKPLQPVFDVLTKRIPGISDISEALGAGEINLLSLSSALRQLPAPPTEILNVIDQAIKLRDYANKIETLASLASGVINVGSFNISNPNGNSLLDAAKSLLGDLGVSDWSSLITTDGGINFDGFKDQISQLPLPAGIGDEINSLWEQLSGTSDETGLSFTFPIVKNPSDVLVGMLLGQEKDLITATLKLKEKLDASFQIKIIPGFFIEVTAKSDIDALARIGYDTRGLQEAIAPLYAPVEGNSDFAPSKILNGLWIDPETHLEVKGDVGIGPGVGLPDFATFTVTGNLIGNLYAKIANPSNSTKIRPFVPGHLTDRLFDVRGSLDAAAKATLKVGIDSPLGFVGFDKTWTFLSASLFTFTTDRIEIPTSLIPPPVTPPQIFTYDAATYTLILQAGASTDENFTVNVIRSFPQRILGGPLDPVRFVSHNTVDISAGGITQRFGGLVDRLYANMGDGNDTLKIIDPASLTLYSLYGGDGDDTITVEGSVDVYIEGGDDDDTIDAGNGRNSDHRNGVRGGLGSDQITFGGGRLDNLVPGAVFYIARDPSDESRDQVTLDNSRSRIDTFYDFYRNVGAYDVRLDIDAADENPVRTIYMSQYDVVTLRSGSGSDSFKGYAADGSEFYGGAGNDRFSPRADVFDPLPVGFNFFGLFPPSITFNGGNGFDTVVVNDSVTRTPRVYELGVSSDSGVSTEVSWADNEFLSFCLKLAGIEDTTFRAYDTAIATVSGWDDGSLTLSAGEVRLAADNSMWWNTTIAVDYAPKITFFDSGPIDPILNRGAGLDENGPYLYMPGNHRIDLFIDPSVYPDLTRTFSFQTMRTRVDVTPALLSRPWITSFEGGANSTLSFISPNYNSSIVTAPNYDFEFESNVLRVNSKAFNYRDVKTLRIFSGQGNDNFIIYSHQNFSTALSILAGIGNDNLAIVPLSGSIFDNVSKYSQFEFEGGEGLDSFSFNNATDVAPALYERDGSRLTALPLNGDTPLNMNVSQFEKMSVTGGLNFDVFSVDNLSNGFFFDNLPRIESISLYGGGGFNSFYVGQRNQSAQTIRGQIVIDAGSGGGNLFVNDSANTTGATVHIDSGNVGWLGSAPGDTLFGPGGSLQFRNLADDTSSGAGMSLTLGSGPDTIYVAPQIATSLNIVGGAPNTVVGDRLFLDLTGVLNPVQSTIGFGAGKLTSSNRKDVNWSGIEGLDVNYVAPPSFLVTNTLNSGPGSLRQAILDANDATNVGGVDQIRFSILGVGSHTIRPLSPLPTISDPVILDATTQAGFAGTPVIELDGSLAGSSHGLNIASGGSTVRGLAINRFVGTPNAGIFVTGPGGNVIQGNYIGTNLAGTAAFPQASQINYGVVLFGNDGNVIGTDGDGINDAGEGNVISGNRTAGILLITGQIGQLPDNNIIAGNRIGTSDDGNTALANGRMGVFFIEGGTGNRIGTNSDGLSDTAERNIISGNLEAGIYLHGDGNVIAGNFIGTNGAGGGSLGNGDGIVVDRSSNNRIGGSQPGAGNVIANSNYSGVILSIHSGGSGTGNSILGNSFFNNSRLGINLSSSNEPGVYYVTPNDAGDTDSGVNNLQNFPEITTALATSTQTVVGGKLQSTAGTQFRIEFFSSVAIDASGYGEGQRYLGFVTATTDSSGVASFVANFPTLVPVGQFISATATDPLGNTSEFSLSAAVVQASSLSNVVTLNLPTSNTVFLVTSPVGSNLTASISSNAGVTPPNGFDFPYGFLDFTLSGIAPGSAANVTISGLDVNQLRDYYKFGPTPGNRSAHWYSFMLGQGNPSDNPAGTGMEIVGGTIVLRLVDGKRGDDDLRADGVIADIGGPVRNHAPVTVNDLDTTDEDTTLTIKTKTLMKNDSDSDGDTLVVTAVGKATNGTVSLANDVVTFRPTADFNGTAGFEYTLSDGYTTSAGRVTIVVDEVNDAPTANPDTATVPEEGTVVIDVRTNDLKGPANESGQTLNVTKAKASRGDVSINNNGTLRYRPSANYFGRDTIEYTVEDNGKTNGKEKPLRSESFVFVTVTPVNDAPIGDDSTDKVDEDDNVRVKLSGSDIETPTANLIFTVTTLPVQGQLLTPSGMGVKAGDRYTGPTTLVYRPGAAREGSGADSFKYTVTDDGGAVGSLFDIATVFLTIAKAVEDGKVTIDSNDVVRIGGTSGNDDIVATKSGSKLQVKINGKVVSDSISISKIGEIRAWGRGGNDKINLSAIQVDTNVHGGFGNDEIIGGGGSNLIFGGEGNDKLSGGARSDLIVGGSGADSISDSQGDDVMFGGNVSNQLTDDFFREVLQQWKNNRIRNTRFKEALIDDNAVDSFFDSLGDDWYLLGATDLMTDLYAPDLDVLDRV